MEILLKEIIIRQLMALVLELKENLYDKVEDGKVKQNGDGDNQIKTCWLHACKVKKMIIKEIKTMKRVLTCRLPSWM